MIDKFELERARQSHHEEIAHGRCVTESMFHILLEMAKADKCPDGTFGDAECLLWSCFREALRNGNH